MRLCQEGQISERFYSCQSLGLLWRKLFQRYLVEARRCGRIEDHRFSYPLRDEAMQEAECFLFSTGPKNVGVSDNRGIYPQIIHFNRDFHYKPSILGYPIFGNTIFKRSQTCLARVGSYLVRFIECDLHKSAQALVLHISVKCWVLSSEIC